MIYIQFDNVHFNQDRQNVAGDLVQMPHLYNFLRQDGTLFTNDHTILISHTAGGITSSLTGLYPDRMGQTSSNAYDAYDSGGTPHNTSSFKYWTDPVGVGGDNLPNMVTDGQKTTPAPWVPYTRAGCDVGGVGTANLELENTSTAAGGDITKVFGNPSPQATEAASDSQAAQTDFVGIAVHCSQASDSVCANNSNAEPDQLPDEPGGYSGFDGLFGAKYVDPAIARGNPCVKDTNGQPITDPVGRCGFPGFDGMLAKNTLGYVAAMQENGVPVTYAYVSDVHDLHVPTLSSDSYSSSATGPGEIAHEQQLHDYDTAFENFFNNLQNHGINPSNTLFVITVDEGDHFAGGVGKPQPGADNLIYDHRTCTESVGVPVEPARRGRRQQLVGFRCPACRRAAVRHPLRRRSDGLRERSADKDRPGRQEARAGHGKPDAARPVREQRTVGPGGGSDGRHRGGTDAPHGQLRSAPDADVHDVREPGLLLPAEQSVHQR